MTSGPTTTAGTALGSPKMNPCVETVPLGTLFREMGCKGILVCNGHANPNVEPLIAGSLMEQERNHKRNFRFMNLDDLVNWITDNRLVNEFRAALSELGIEPSIGK